MLAAKYRLRNFNFSAFFKDSIKKNRQHLRIFQKSNNIGHPRFSIPVPKSLCKSAVARNRIRRRIYETIRMSIHNFSTADYVIVPHKDIKDLTQKEILCELIS